MLRCIEQLFRLTQSKIIRSHRDKSQAHQSLPFSANCQLNTHDPTIVSNLFPVILLRALHLQPSKMYRKTNYTVSSTFVFFSIQIEIQSTTSHIEPTETAPHHRCWPHFSAPKKPTPPQTPIGRPFDSSHPFSAAAYHTDPAVTFSHPPSSNRIPRRTNRAKKHIDRRRSLQNSSPSPRKYCPVTNAFA